MRSFVFIASVTVTVAAAAASCSDPDEGSRDDVELGGPGAHRDGGSDTGNPFGNSRDGGRRVFMRDAQTIVLPSCGDGEVGEDEECDDGNSRSGDGCSADCGVESGWACVFPAEPCAAALCGDGIIAGSEECEDGDDPPASGDGCSDVCRYEDGFQCGEPGEACHATACNDGKHERGEPCDDGNQIIGDGCTPFCDVEPDCSTGACHSRCGDGLILENDDEECDDGNTQDGDGCSASCKSEAGYECTIETAELPNVLRVPVTYRDMTALPTGSSVRHPDFEADWSGNAITPGLVDGMLDAEGKPVMTGICDDDSPTGPMCPWDQQLSTQANFAQWYRDTPGVNATIVTLLELTRDPSDGAYRIEQSAFFPLDGNPGSLVGQNKEGVRDGHDFGFTSEIRSYFTYTPNATAPQTLTFSGDDDVWVFINHQLAVDIGGLHPEQNGSIQLDQARATELGLQAGQIYEIVLFHAERHTGQSNFNLTLSGFLSAKSTCVPRCGDGILAGDEECDDGLNAGGYNGCMPDCTLGPYCGDRIVQEANGEECDDGNHVGGDGCSADCKDVGPA